MLPLPEKFDANEWAIIAVFIGSFLLLLLPKRFPVSMSFLLMIFSSFTARTLDHILAAPMLDLYDVMDTEKYELFGVLTYFLYAPFAYLFVYFHDALKIKHLRTVGYIFIWSLMALGVEWIATKMNVFTYKQWHLGYSFPVYLLIQYLTILFFRYLKKVYHLN